MALVGRSFVLLDFPAKMKLQLSRTIESLGGTMSYAVTRSIYAVITTADEYARKSAKILSAEKFNVLILDAAYLDAVAKDKNRGFVFEFSYALNRPIDLPDLLLKNPIAYLRRLIPSVAQQVNAIAAVVYEEPDTPSVSSLGDAASSDDSESNGPTVSWANEVAASADTPPSACSIPSL